MNKKILAVTVLLGALGVFVDFAVLHFSWVVIGALGVGAGIWLAPAAIPSLKAA